MGCDIHLFTERKKTIKGDTKWVNIDLYKLDPYTGEFEIRECYGGRNYDLFAILADVRNYNNNKCISKPKGMPNDASEVVKKECESWGCDGHSHSHFTMKELYDFFNENKTIKYSGYVDELGLSEIEKGEMPHSFRQWTNIPNYKYAEWEQENDILKYLIEDLENHFRMEHYCKDSESEKFRIVFWFDN